MTYACAWHEIPGPRLVGRVSVSGGKLELTGRSGEHEARRTVALADLLDVHVERGPGGKHLVIAEAGGRRFEVFVLEGAGALHELAEQVAPH